MLRSFLAVDGFVRMRDRIIWCVYCFQIRGGFMKERIVFHIDVNNAFLSWTATLLLKNGYKQDIRKIPSIIGGDEQ